MQIPKRVLVLLSVFIYSMLLFIPAAFADTDGTELKVADEPEQLIIQLGVAWAGVEFQLRTDAGIYPAPIVVSSEGLLSMELGGSKTYTLSCIKSPLHPPSPKQSGFDNDTQGGSETAEGESSPENELGPDILQADETENIPYTSVLADENGTDFVVPTTHLLLFIGGLSICAGGLLTMWLIKRRRLKNHNEDDEDDSI